MSMNKIESNVSTFLKSLNAVSEQLKNAEVTIAGHEQEILQSIDELRKTIDQEYKDMSSPQRNQENDSLEKSLNAYRAVMDAWEQETLKTIEGRQFVQWFEKTIILLVYGKVNCGKSSLGNFVSGLPFQNNETLKNLYNHLLPDFYTYDKAEERHNHKRADKIPPKRIEGGGFEVKPTEATSSIQWFTLNALSWIDTPGIHSLTGIQQELAKDYLNNADLVLYLNNSDSPLRDTDLKELQTIGFKEKPTLIVVSRSDNNEDDEVDGEVVSKRVKKSEKDRKDQTQWIQEQLDDGGIRHILKDPEVVHTSVALAKKALEEGDEQVFIDSGIPDLYQQISRVLEQHALDLKIQNPKKRINTLIKTILEGRGTDNETSSASLQTIRETFEKVHEQLNQSITQLHGLHKVILDTAWGDLQPRLESILQSAEQKLEMGESETNCNQFLEREIAETINKEIHTVFENEVIQVIQNFEKQKCSNLSDIKIEGMDLKDKFADITVTDTMVYKGTGSAIGGIAGGAIGIFFGPFGALAGSIAGGMIGSKAGEFLSGSKTIQTRVGSNADEVIAVIFQVLKQKLPDFIQQQLKEVDAQYLHPQKVFLETSFSAFQKLENQLKALRFS